MKDNELPPNPAAGPNMSLKARSDILEQDVFQNSEMAYARNVEVRSPALLAPPPPPGSVPSSASCYCCPSRSSELFAEDAHHAFLRRISTGL